MTPFNRKAGNLRPNHPRGALSRAIHGFSNGGIGFAVGAYVFLTLNDLFSLEKLHDFPDGWIAIAGGMIGAACCIEQRERRAPAV